MNKTININLGGFFFHIDEIAYQKLKRYLDAISRSLSDDPQGKEEIIADIEARISELLSEKITDPRQVVNEADIDEVISIMGQPEDYSDAEENYNSNYNSNNYRSTSNKKLFRDSSDKFLAGVASGLGHYFNIDVIWVRLAFLLLTLAGVGFGVLAYIILWILLPEARTTSEKLQMEGEAVNIDNIEKKIRNEFENISAKVKEGASELSDKISNADYEKLRSQTKTGAQDFIDTLSKILLTLFKVFGKFIGVLLIFIAGATLVGLLIGLFSISSFEILHVDSNFIHYPPFFYEASLPKWLLSIFFFILIGIPFLVLFVLGLRILSPNIKKLGSTTILTLLGIWLIALLAISFSGIEYLTTHAYSGTNVSKHSIEYNSEEPLKIRVVNNDNLYYNHNLRNRSNAINVSIDNTDMKYSNDVNIDVLKSETGNAYIRIKKTSEGRKRSNANINAEDIIYNFKIANNTIVFDAYFLSQYKNMWKDEEVKATIYIPEGTVVYFENSSKRFLDDVKNTENIYDTDMANHHFKMTSLGFQCTDCSTQNTEEQHKEEEETSHEETNEYHNISFLHNSTINSKKAELIINKNTTKTQVRELITWFKEKKNIHINLENQQYNNDNTIKSMILKINCNDGYKGEIKITNNTLNNIPKGFRRLYNKRGEIAFKTW